MYRLTDPLMLQAGIDQAGLRSVWQRLHFGGLMNLGAVSFAFVVLLARR